MKNKAGVSAVQRVQDMAARASLTNREAQRRAAKAITLSPPSFEEDFNIVAAHFNLRESGEYDEAKELANIAGNDARLCYQSIANSIRGTAARGINERIHARNAAERKRAA